MAVILGIDPGLKGGMAFIAHNGSVVHVEKMPVTKIDGSSCIDFHEITRRIKTYEPRLIVMEKVHSFPGQGVASCFTFGMGFGGLQGIAAALGVSYVLVRPQKWQKEILGGIDKSLGKARSLVYCRQRHPNIEPSHKHDGIADAICLAEWGSIECTKA